MTIDDLKTALRDSAATPHSLMAAAEGARGLAATCGEAIERLSADRHRQLVEIDDAQLAQLDSLIALEHRTRDRALALADALEVRKTEAEATLADQKRQNDIAQAHAKVAAFEAAARKLWPSIMANARKLIELEAEASVACRIAGEHGERIDPSAWRSSDVRAPAVVLSTERRMLWADENGTALPLEHQNRVTSHGDGRLGHELSRPGVSFSNVEYHKAEFFHVRFKEAVTSRGSLPLATTIALPALFTGDKTGWNPAEGGHAASIPGVLAKLKEPVLKPERIVVEELVPVARYQRFLEGRDLVEAAAEIEAA